MSNSKDLTGQKIGRLTVIDRAPKKGYFVYWNCECECGNKKAFYASNLYEGSSKSCGCLQRELAANRKKTHGFSKGKNIDPLYSVWKAMNQRCKNPNLKNWEYYGGRGIQVCERWDSKTENGFVNFKIDMSPYPGKPYTLDRLNNDGHYCPENCRWATCSEQNSNRRPRKKK